MPKPRLPQCCALVRKYYSGRVTRCLKRSRVVVEGKAYCLTHAPAPSAIELHVQRAEELLAEAHGILSELKALRRSERREVIRNRVS